MADFYLWLHNPETFGGHLVVETKGKLENNLLAASI